MQSAILSRMTHSARIPPVTFIVPLMLFLDGQCSCINHQYKCPFTVAAGAGDTSFNYRKPQYSINLRCCEMINWEEKMQELF